MVPRPGRPHPGTMSDTATSSRPRLERRPDDRVVAGVASGLAQHFGIDVTIVRVGFVVATVLAFDANGSGQPQSERVQWAVPDALVDELNATSGT